MGIILNPKIALASLRKLLGYPQSLCIRSSVVFPNQKCKCEVEGAAFEELDIVKIIANTYQDDGLNPGEQGTIVLVHNNNGETAYEVEFDNWTKKLPIKTKTLAGDKIEMVKKWRE